METASASVGSAPMSCARPTTSASTWPPSSGVPLNVDLDTTLTVVAGNLHRMLARKLPRYETATPDKIWRPSSTPPEPCTSASTP
ncbi:hypothetical protein [Streptomyces sp. CA-106110]|uniref:hypothetical protein n=2 Tax=unclassified Streptomyces TaxID=2593676 RepID=UPI003D91FAEF